MERLVTEHTQPNPDGATISNFRAYVAVTTFRACNVQRMNPADLLSALFNWVGHPVALDDVVNVVAELWGMKDQPHKPRPKMMRAANSSITFLIRNHHLQNNWNGWKICAGSGGRLVCCRWSSGARFG